MPVSAITKSQLGQSELANYEPQRVSNCIIKFGLGGGDDDVLEMALSTFPLPKTANGIIEHQHVNEKRKFAGTPTFDDLQVVYKDMVDVNIAQILQKWRYMVYNPETGQIGLASQYKKIGTITQFAPNGGFIRQWKLIGAWPSAFDAGDADLSGEDTVNISVTITIDKAVPDTAIKPSGGLFGAAANAVSNFAQGVANALR
jgi:hypothetical protein